MNIGWPHLLTLTPSSLLYTSSVSSDPFSLPFNSHLPISCPSSLSFFSPLPSPLTPHSCSSPGDLTCLPPQVHLLSLLSSSLLQVSFPSPIHLYLPFIFLSHPSLSPSLSYPLPLHSTLSSPVHHIIISLFSRALSIFGAHLSSLSLLSSPSYPLSSQLSHTN